MAVDSNVLIFERIREEMDGGKAPRAAIDLGFKRAFGTIIDTHVTTISAAAFLFQFGTGPVRGFAVTLVIGLAASMFTAVFVSHLLFDLDLRVEAEGRDDLHLRGRTRTRASLQEHPHRLPRRQVDLHRDLDRPVGHRPRLAPRQGGATARHRLHGRRADRLRVQPEARREPDPAIVEAAGVKVDSVQRFDKAEKNEVLLRIPMEKKEGRDLSREVTAALTKALFPKGTRARAPST